MVQSFALVDSPSLGDLKVFLGRAARLDQGGVRLIGGSGVLAVYAPVLHPRGLLDDAPTVLGLRTFALAETASFDVVVSARQLLDRLALLSVTVNADDGPIGVLIPPPESSPAWVGISPPRGGWLPVGEVPAPVLEAAAALNLPEGDGYVWIAGETDIAKALRKHFVDERGIRKSWVKAAGYWRHGSVGFHENHDDKE